MENHRLIYLNPELKFCKNLVASSLGDQKKLKILKKYEKKITRLTSEISSVFIFFKNFKKKL